MVYTLDNHTCNLYYNKDTNNTTIYYSYNNNTASTTLIYLNDEKSFLYEYNTVLTARQKKLLAKACNKFYKIINKGE